MANPNLKAESSANTELGFAWQLDKINVSGALYQNDIDDMIVQQAAPTSTPFFAFGSPIDREIWNVNQDKAQLRGGELSIAGGNAKTQWQAGYSHVRGTDATTGADLDGIEADSLMFTATHQIQAFTLATTLTRALPTSRNSDNTAYDGYLVGDIRVGYQPASLPQVSLQLDVNNVTDRYYRVANSVLYSEGRSAEMNLTFRF